MGRKLLKENIFFARHRGYTLAALSAASPLYQCYIWIYSLIA